LLQRREAGPDRVDVHACAEHFGHRKAPSPARTAARSISSSQLPAGPRVSLLPWRKRRWFDQRNEIGPLGRAY
jgi:hypothetical protein